MDVNDVTGRIVDSAMKVHTALGPGLLESAYGACLGHELRKRGLRLQSQVPMPIQYDGVMIEVGYRLDFLVEGSVIVELKAVEKVLPIHEAQLLSYLKLSGCRVGLLINFHALRLKRRYQENGQRTVKTLEMPISSIILRVLCVLCG